MPLVGIYKITSPIQSVYIGASTDIMDRIRSYKNVSLKSQRLLRDSILKYGWDSHTFQIVHELPVDISPQVLHTYEKIYIEHYRANNNRYPGMGGLNLTDGGKGTSGHVVGQETRDRLRKMYTGVKKRPEDIIRGERHSLFNVRGEQHPAFGYRHSESAKIKIGQANSLGKHNLAQKVINIITGEIFGSVKEAALSAGMNYSAFKSQLNGGNKNSTNFRHFNKKTNA